MRIHSLLLYLPGGYPTPPLHANTTRQKERGGHPERPPSSSPHLLFPFMYPHDSPNTRKAPSGPE